MGANETGATLNAIFLYPNLRLLPAQQKRSSTKTLGNAAMMMKKDSLNGWSKRVRAYRRQTKSTIFLCKVHFTLALVVCERIPFWSKWPLTLGNQEHYRALLNKQQLAKECACVGYLHHKGWLGCKDSSPFPSISDLKASNRKIKHGGIFSCRTNEHLNCTYWDDTEACTTYYEVILRCLEWKFNIRTFLAFKSNLRYQKGIVSKEQGLMQEIFYLSQFPAELSCADMNNPLNNSMVCAIKSVKTTLGSNWEDLMLTDICG